MFYDPNQAFDNRSLRNAAPHIYKKAAEICAGEDEREDDGDYICAICEGIFENPNPNNLCPSCADEAEEDENQ